MKKRKKIKIDQLNDNDIKFCYICNKKIKTFDYYSIGKDKNGIQLYRHRKCKPTRGITRKIKK